MIRIHRPTEESTLDRRTRAALKKRSMSAGKWLHQDKRIQRAWRNFLRSNPRKDVDKHLERILRGKCAYCEATLAINIDHFYPKSKFPERMFLWENFLLACANCNRYKHDHFQSNRANPFLSIRATTSRSTFFGGITIPALSCLTRTRITRIVVQRRVIGSDWIPNRFERNAERSSSEYLTLCPVL